jgi:hypothetical protein
MNSESKSMARVQMEQIVEHLKIEVRKALAAAVESSIPGAQFDKNQLFRAFRKKVGSKCGMWSQVPDEYVDKEE